MLSQEQSHFLFCHTYMCLKFKLECDERVISYTVLGNTERGAFIRVKMALFVVLSVDKETTIQYYSVGVFR